MHQQKLTKKSELALTDRWKLSLSFHMCRTNSYTGRQLTDNNIDRQYSDHLQVMIQFMLRKLVFLGGLQNCDFYHNSGCFHIPDHVSTPLLYRQILAYSTHTHTVSQTHTFIIPRDHEALRKPLTVQSSHQSEVSLVQCTCVTLSSV